MDDAIDAVVKTAPPSIALKKTAASNPLPAPSVADVSKRALNPASKQLTEAGLPPSVAHKWADLIIADTAVQTRASAQRPFSRAYKAWAEKGYDQSDSHDKGAAADSEEGEDVGPGFAGGSAAHRAAMLFGDTLQNAAILAKFKSTAPANAVTAALHGKDADVSMVAALQKMYLEQVRVFCARLMPMLPAHTYRTPTNTHTISLR